MVGDGGMTWDELARLFPGLGLGREGRMATERARGRRDYPPFVDLVQDELERAGAGHEPMASLHEGYAVLLEEVDDLWAEVKKQASQRSRKRLLAEVVQVGAMAQRMAEDLGLVEG